MIIMRTMRTRINETRGTGRRGFFFAIDSLIAIVIAFILISAVVLFLNRAEEDRFSTLYMEKVANDMLYVMNRNGTLQTLNSGHMRNVLAGMLPRNLAAQLNVTTYECADQNCNSFRFDNNIITLIPTNAAERDAVIARTGFVTFSGGKLNKFAIAELRIWLI